MKIKRLRYNRKKVFLGLFLFLIVVGLTFGYAFVTTQLSIDGVVRVKDARWDIHFTNFQPITGSVEPEDEPTISNTSVTFSAKLQDPGEFYGFTVDVVNNGTINADISNLSVTPNFSTIDYIDATISYGNGNPIQIGDVLVAGKTKTIKVLLKYKEGIDESLYPIDDELHNVTVALDYEQYTGRLEANFATDSWDQILVAYDSGSLTQLTEDMNNGVTREVELDLDNDPLTQPTIAHLRIANLSKPAECSTQGFSQTACGFVIEFSDIIIAHRMNPYTAGVTADGNSNKGGWEYSDMRAYLNGTVYEYENIDYSTSGVFSVLPTDLKNNIINTTVVSGYGATDSSHGNFVTTDKLYLLSSHEVWEDVDGDANSGIDYFDKSYNNTRQLDYYLSQGVTTSYTSGAIKQRNGSNSSWALRSASFNYSTSFSIVDPDGEWNNYVTSTSRGVSPAFRIAS